MILEGKLVIEEYFNRMRELRVDADYFLQKAIDTRSGDKMLQLHARIVEQMERDSPF